MSISTLPPNLEPLLDRAPFARVLAAAAEAVGVLDRTGIPRGIGEGSICGVSRAHELGIVRVDPFSYALEPWSFVGKGLHRDEATIVIPVCALGAEEASARTGLPLTTSQRRPIAGVALRPDPVITFLAAVARDHGQDIAGLVAAVQAGDGQALAFVREGVAPPLPGLLPDGRLARALRRLPTLRSVEELATMAALATPARGREAMLEEYLAGSGRAWSAPAESFFEPFFVDTEGLPVWHEQLDALLVAVADLSPLDAPSARSLWHRRGVEMLRVQMDLAAALRDEGIGIEDAVRLSMEVARRNVATFSRAHLVPQVLLTVAAARALLDDPDAYQCRLEDHVAIFGAFFHED